MAKVWENINGKCYCYGRLVSNRGCDGANCRTCCYNLGKFGKTTSKLTLADYNILPKEVQVYVEKPLEPHVKVISSLNINKTSFLNPSGDNRKVTVTGDIGSVFTLTIKDSSGCSILENDLENVKMDKHTFSFGQEFPVIKSGLTSETYTITLTPSATTVWEKSSIPEKLYQYPKPTVTITKLTSQTGPALGLSGSDVTKTGEAGSYTDNIPGYASSTYTLAVTENPSTAGFFYVKDNPKFEDNITTNTLIKKVIKRDDINDRSKINTLNCLYPAPAVSDGSRVSASYNGEVKDTYKWKGKVSYTKTVFASLEATDGTKITSCNDATDRFKLENTEKIFEGMKVTCISNGKYINDEVVKVWEDKLTLSTKRVIRDGAILTFEYEETGTIGGNTTLPHNTTIEIEPDGSIIDGNMKVSGSGTNALTVTTIIDVVKFGKEDVTYTLDLDNFIVRKPNAYNQEVVAKKDTATKINIILKDIDSNATSKTATIVSGPYKGVAVIDGEKDIFTYTPNTGFTGEDIFKFTMSDGTNSSDEKTIFITVK